MEGKEAMAEALTILVPILVPILDQMVLTTLVPTLDPTMTSLHLVLMVNTQIHSLSSSPILESLRTDLWQEWSHSLRLLPLCELCIPSDVTEA